MQGHANLLDTKSTAYSSWQTRHTWHSLSSCTWKETKYTKKKEKNIELKWKEDRKIKWGLKTNRAERFAVGKLQGCRNSPGNMFGSCTKLYARKRRESAKYGLFIFLPFSTPHTGYSKNNVSLFRNMLKEQRRVKSTCCTNKRTRNSTRHEYALQLAFS